MKFSKFCFTLATAIFAVGAFADAANVLISFSTEADYYADGTPVKDGEWYALCWSPRTTFGGLTLDCTPVNADEKVLILAPLAEGGHCPYTIFEVDSVEAPEGGYYFVYVLDTRDAFTGAVATSGREEAGAVVPVASVNGTIAKTSNVSATASVSTTGKIAKATEASGVFDWSVADPKITAFKVEGAKVKITVAGMMSGLSYEVRMGETPKAMRSYEVSPVSEDGKAVFYVTPGSARFFKIVSE